MIQIDVVGVSKKVGQSFLAKCICFLHIVKDIYIQLQMRRLIKLHAIIVALVVSLASCADSTISCHYSCKQCVGESYTLCTMCLEDKNITIVEDPTVSDPQYINSNIPTGLCTGDVPPKVNALGVLLIIICSAVAGVVRTPSSIYLISTLQTLSLISFVEVAWVYPVGYLLQSLQYFMVFNWMGSGYKVQDQTMRERQYYRLDLYMRESTFMKNIAIVGLANLAVVIAIIVLAIWKYRKDKLKKYEAQLEMCPEKSEKMQMNSQQMSQTIYKQEPNFLQKSLQMGLRICLTAFFLLIQETSLVIMVGLRFERPISMWSKGIPIIYCIFLLAFFIYTYLNKLWFFPNKQTQFLGTWRKIGLPVLTIIPYKITFLIVVVLLIFVILESFFDFKGGKQKLLSRITLFKLIELIVVVLAGAYILTELSRNIQLQTNIIRVFLSIGIIAFFACFFIELFFGIYETYFNSKSNQVDNQNEGKNVFQAENTVENIEPNAEDNKNKDVMIYDIEDQPAEHAHNPHENRNMLKNSLKITETQNNPNTDQNDKGINNSISNANGSFNDKANRSENTDETDKAAKEKQQALRRQKQQEERARKKKQQQQQEAQRKRKQQLQAQRKRQQQLEALRKKKEEEARRKEEQQAEAKRKKDEEEARKKKQKQQLEAKRKREEEQEQARLKKEQEEYEAMIREKRKKKYESKKDEDLRKRYGM